MEEKLENKKKTRKIGWYFVKMFFVFMLIFIFQQLGMTILYNNFEHLRYGEEIIVESIWAVLMLMVLLLYKNSYVFTQKRDKFLDSLKIAWPIMVLSLIILVVSFIEIIDSVNIPVVLNLAIYCLLIGLVEEFLCRGWLLNEFLERFSNSKKNIIISIVLSSLVFGFIHIFNVFTGQSLLDTLAQIANATLAGVGFALVYYKTKNIWSVVFLHGFWDFSVMIGESIYLTDCYNTKPTSEIVLYTIIISIGFVLAELVYCYWLFKQTDLNSNKQMTKISYYVLPIIYIILYLGCGFFTPNGYDEYYVCPEYDYKLFEGDNAVLYYNVSKYNLEYKRCIYNEDSIQDNTSNKVKVETYNFELYENSDTKNIEFKNSNTNDIVVLSNLADDFLLLDNDSTFVILIQSDYNKVLYGLYDKTKINNNGSYLNSIKDNLKEYVVPSISAIGATKRINSDYAYATIRTNIYDRLYFDELGNLYFDGNK